MKINKVRIYTLLIMLFVIYMTFTVIRGYVDVQGAIAYLAVSVISVVLYYKKLQHRVFLYFIFYAIILYLNYLVGNELFDFTKSVSEIFQIFSVLFISFIFIQNKTYQNYFSKIVIVSLLIIVLLSITSIPQLLLNPNLLRQGNDITGYTGSVIDRAWVGSYSMVHGIICLFPILLFLIKYKPLGLKIRLVSLASLILMFYFVFVSNTTIPLILSTIGIIIATFIDGNKSIKINVIKIGIILLPILLIFGFIDNIMFFLTQNIGSVFSTEGSNYNKMLILSDEGINNYRSDLYFMSLESFTKYPIFGSNSIMDISQHSFFLDRLASLGILGFIPLLAVMIAFPIEIYKHLYYTRNFYIVSVYIYLLLWSSKNIMSYEMLLYPIVILPGLCLFAENLVKNRLKK